MRYRQDGSGKSPKPAQVTSRCAGCALNQTGYSELSRFSIRAILCRRYFAWRSSHFEPQENIRRRLTRPSLTAARRLNFNALLFFNERNDLTEIVHHGF